MRLLSRGWNWTQAAIGVLSGLFVLVFMAIVILVCVSALESLLLRDRVQFMLWVLFGFFLLLIVVIGVACLGH